MGKVKSGKYVKFFIYLVAVVLVNLAGITLFQRFDLTANGVYSLSDASRRAVATLSEPLTINVFFTKNLPAPYNSTERYLRDLLEEYAIYAGKYFNYRFYDVSPEEGDLKPGARTNQDLADSYGISPIQIQVIEKDEVKFQKAYMGLVILHGDLIERIPTITSVDRLEYQLTTAIMKLNNKVSALLRLQGKIRIALFLSSSLNKVAPVIGLNDLPDLPQRVSAIVDKLNPTLLNKLAYVRLDPTTDPDAARELQTKKINLLSLKWPDLPRENLTAGEGTVGLVLEHGGKTATLQLVNVLRIPIIGTRYELVAPDTLENLIGETIDSLIDINENIGYLTDKGTLPLMPQPRANPAEQPNAETLNNFRTVVSQNYTIKDVNLKDGKIPSSLRTLVIARPTETFSDDELFQIDQFLMQGKNLLLIPDSFNEIMPQQQMPPGMNPGPRYEPLKTGLEKLLDHYGVRVKQSYVMDENCFNQEMPQSLGGGERPIYFAPLIESQMINHDLAFMQNINRLVAVRISPLELIEDRLKESDIKAQRVFSSSAKSWEMRGRIDLNPGLIRPPQSENEFQSFPLAYLLEGGFSSYFTGKPLPEKKMTPPDAGEDAKTGATDETNPEADQDKKPMTAAVAPPQAPSEENPANVPLPVESEGAFISRGKPGRIFIMASSEMLTDNVIDAQGRGANAVFILNVVDALNGREDIAVLRGKKQDFNPLQPIGAGAKTAVKAFNIAGLPILVVLFGVAVWLRRMSRKRRIQEMFQG
ncbi:MAG: Gldg family protein [Desulfobacterales bacterium]|nr:Gldg family protein [Desulfobacterales bacterium]